MALTAEQIDQMEAGPEMDRLVAESLGFVLDLGNELNESCWLCNGRYVGTVSREHADGEDFWQPSHDWNDAMAAAEKRLEQPWLILHEGGYWNVRKKLYGIRDLDKNEADYRVAPLASCPSGPLAICRAILKLKATT